MHARMHLINARFSWREDPQLYIALSLVVGVLMASLINDTFRRHRGPRPR